MCVLSCSKYQMSLVNSILCRTRVNLWGLSRLAGVLLPKWTRTLQLGAPFFQLEGITNEYRGGGIIVIDSFENLSNGWSTSITRFDLQQS